MWQLFACFGWVRSPLGILWIGQWTCTTLPLVTVCMPVPLGAIASSLVASTISHVGLIASSSQTSEIQGLAGMRSVDRCSSPILESLGCSRIVNYVVLRATIMDYGKYMTHIHRSQPGHQLTLFWWTVFTAFRHIQVWTQHPGLWSQWSTAFSPAVLKSHQLFIIHCQRTVWNIGSFWILDSRMTQSAGHASTPFQLSAASWLYDGHMSKLQRWITFLHSLYICYLCNRFLIH